MTYPTLFQHNRRPDWGMAVIAWERDGKRGYLFESGMLRALTEPFYALMTEIEDQAAHRDTLERLLAQVDVTAPSMFAPRTSMAPALRFALHEQIAVFKAEYPDGFRGEWATKVRGEGAKRPLKRHRNAAIEGAKRELSAAVFEQALSSGEYGAAWQAVVRALESTDLVPQAQTRALAAAANKATASSVSAVADLLYGEGDPSTRFDGYVMALQSLLGKAPSWELTTGPLALVHPLDYVCVRRTSFQTQADWLIPELRSNKRVCAISYGGFSHLAKAVSDQLHEAGLGDHDFIDVHDFIKHTTSPTAQSRMLRLRDESSDGSDPAAAA